MGEVKRVQQTVVDYVHYKPITAATCKNRLIPPVKGTIRGSTGVGHTTEVQW